LCALAFGTIAFAQTTIDPCPSGPGACRLALPASGAYLGILSQVGIDARESSLPPAGVGIDRTFATHLTSAEWTDIEAWLPGADFGKIGPDADAYPWWRVPVINWKCDQTPSANGTDYLIATGDPGEISVIKQTADILRQYQHPVILRWYWEFNVYKKNSACLGSIYSAPGVIDPSKLATAQGYFVQAWRKIWDIFQREGATNVMFSWTVDPYNPEGNSAPYNFYPGNAYVDWIGIDIFPRKWPATFSDKFDRFYQDFSQDMYSGRPLMVGATGAPNFDQSNADTEYQFDYLTSVLNAAKSTQYPLWKAFAYFDSIGCGTSCTDWTLDLNGWKNNPQNTAYEGGGVWELATMGASPQFNAIPEWCSISLKQTSASTDSAVVAIKTTQNCPWSVGPLPDWITTGSLLNTGPSPGVGGVGPSSVRFYKLAGDNIFSATIEIGGASITLQFDPGR